MNTDLKNLLDELGEKNRASKTTVEEWQASVKNLFADIRKWLKDSDPGGAIEIRENQEKIREPGLGYYLMPRLDLYVFGTWVGIIPKARRTVASAKPPRKSVPERAQGRVDITDEIRRYVLFRFQEDGGDVWLIDGLQPASFVDERGILVADEHGILAPATQPFDQEAFEKALLSYLR